MPILNRFEIRMTRPLVTFLVSLFSIGERKYRSKFRSFRFTLPSINFVVTLRLRIIFTELNGEFAYIFCLDNDYSRRECYSSIGDEDSRILKFAAHCQIVLFFIFFSLRGYSSGSRSWCARAGAVRSRRRRRRRKMRAGEHWGRGEGRVEDRKVQKNIRYEPLRWMTTTTINVA